MRVRNKCLKRQLIAILVGLPVLSNILSFVIFAPLFTPGAHPTSADFRRAGTALGVAILLIEIAAVISIMFFLRREHSTLGDVIHFRRDRIPLYLRTGLLALLPTLLAGWIFVRAQAWAGVNMDISRFTPLEVGLWLVVIPVTAACLEEIIWRGYAIPRLGGTRRGLLWSSVSFALFHGLFNPLVLVATFAQGMIWGWTYRRTESTVPGMVLHFISRYLIFLPGFG